MKLKYFLLIAIAAAMWQTAYSQYDNIWYKQLPNTDVISKVLFSHDSKKLLCYKTPYPNIIIFDAATGTLINDKIPTMQNPTFSKDDLHLYGIIGKRMAYYNLNTGIDESVATQITENVDAMSMTQDENYIITTTNNGFSVWETKTGKLIKSKLIPKRDTSSHSQSYPQIRANCDNSKIFLSVAIVYLDKDSKGFPVYTQSQTIEVYDFITLDSIGCVYSINRGNNSSVDFTLSEYCDFLAWGRYIDGGDFSIQIYDIKASKILSTIDFKAGAGHFGMKFFSEDQYLVTSTSAGADVWEVVTGKFVKKVEGGTLYSLDISNDVKYGAASVADYLFLFNMLNFTGVSEHNLNLETIFPNPTTGEIIMKSSYFQQGQLKIELFDLNGNLLKILFDWVYAQGDLRFDISFVVTGIYILKANRNNTVKTFKIIKGK